MYEFVFNHESVTVYANGEFLCWIWIEEHNFFDKCAYYHNLNVSGGGRVGVWME